MYKKVLPSHRLFKRFEEQIVTGDVGLRDVDRMGGQIMLQHAVEIKMSAFLDRDYYQNNPGGTAANGRRNGYEKHTVLTGESPIHVHVPQARDLPEGAKAFGSKILEAHASRTETLDELVNWMYVTVMSTRDIETVFGEVLTGRGVSRSTVSKITERLSEDLAAFRRRDLSNKNVLYLFVNGTYLNFRVESERKDRLLAAYGIREDGSKVFLYVGPAQRAFPYFHFLRRVVKRNLPEQWATSQWDRLAP